MPPVLSLPHLQLGRGTFSPRRGSRDLPWAPGPGRGFVLQGQDRAAGVGEIEGLAFT
jgi:hypothetical protein